MEKDIDIWKTNKVRKKACYWCTNKWLPSIYDFTKLCVNLVKYDGLKSYQAAVAKKKLKYAMIIDKMHGCMKQNLYSVFFRENLLDVPR